MIETASDGGGASASRLTPSACLLCGASRYEVLLAYDRPDAYEMAAGVGGDGYARHWVRCAGCGFHYARYSRDPDVLDRIYVSAYRDEAAAWRRHSIEETFRRIVALPPEESETWARIDWIKAELRALAAADLLGWGPGPHRLLDIGGATGVFAYLFQDGDASWRANVVDPSSDGRFLEAEHGIRYLDQAYAPGAFGERFHLASLVFVLEHLADPIAILRHVKADLSPGGLVYIKVPDSLAFGRKPADDDIFNACHLWMFSPESLSRALQEADLELFAFRRGRTLRGHYALSALAGPPR